MNKVRYLTIPRVSIELVANLSEHETAQFIKIIFSCFRQLEDGQGLAYEETDSPILNIALREAVEELETGYKNYIQKMNARKKPSHDPKESDSEPPKDQRSISDQSSINHQSTIDQNQSESESEKSRSDNINQIRINLNQMGYTDAEISEIMTRTDLSQIHNPELYIRKSIDRERKKQKPISAQRYEQRDYRMTEAEQAKHADDLLDSLVSMMN